MDHAVYIPANLDIPAQLEMSPEHVCHLDNGVVAPSSALVIKHVIYDLYILQLYLVLTIPKETSKAVNNSKCHNSVNCDRPGECSSEKDCLR